MTSRQKAIAFAGTACRRLCTRARKLTNAEVSKKRNELFGREKARQAALVSRVEKIQVEHKGPPEDCVLLMNKSLSTPFNCAMHIQEVLVTRSVVALVNGQPWDMHRPLEEDCELRFLHFKDEDPHLSNEAFWRTGSFLLGYGLERVFKDEHYVELCSFPKASLQSGSFVYDANLGVSDWNPSEAELQCMSRAIAKLQYEDQGFERLTVDASKASAMFEDNRFKSAQIPQIAAQSATGSSVTMYRLGEHVDISSGPLISSTNLLGRLSITAIHDIESAQYGPLKRVQGIAIPRQLPVHFWVYNILCERASKLNKSPVPGFETPPKAVAENNNS